MQRLRRRVLLSYRWAVLSFVLYICFISEVDGAELLVGALLSVAVGVIAAAGVETAARNAFGANGRWYLPVSAWPLDLLAGCALLARAVVARASGRGALAPELRTVRLRPGVSPALAGFWLSSTPGTCVVGVEGRVLTVHALRPGRSRIETALDRPPHRGR